MLVGHALFDFPQAWALLGSVGWLSEALKVLLGHYMHSLTSAKDCHSALKQPVSSCWLQQHQPGPSPSPGLGRELGFNLSIWYELKARKGWGFDHTVEGWGCRLDPMCQCSTVMISTLEPPSCLNLSESSNQSRFGSANQSRWERKNQNCSKDYGHFTTKPQLGHGKPLQKVLVSILNYLEFTQI